MSGFESHVLRSAPAQQGMVDSGFGRTDLAEIWQRRMEARRAAETEDAGMRKPGTLFALVHAECFEPPVQVGGECGRPAALVIEDEHSDTPGLSVAPQPEAWDRGAGSGLAHRPRDPIALGGRTMAEE